MVDVGYRALKGYVHVYSEMILLLGSYDLFRLTQEVNIRLGCCGVYRPISATALSETRLVLCASTHILPPSV